jgi:hypothetical protein
MLFKRLLRTLLRRPRLRFHRSHGVRAQQLARSLGPGAGVGNRLRTDSTIESGKYRLDKRVVQHLPNRLPGGDPPDS